MRHRNSGRHLGRTPSHRKAMLRNLAVSLILSARPEEGDPRKPHVAGRVITTVEKAKEVRPLVEKLVTLARKAVAIQKQAAAFGTSAARRTDAWQSWRKSEEWQKWSKAISPAVALRRRAFSRLRDKKALEILFTDLAARFEERNGGYTRIVRLAEFRLGDAGRKAMIEFVGKSDRKKASKRQAPTVTEGQPATSAGTQG